MSLIPFVLVCVFAYSKTEVIITQDSPPGGAVACPGDKIVYRCNTNGTEAAMIWQVCDRPELIATFDQFQNEANITLQIPDGGIAECSFHTNGTFIVSTLTTVAPINVTSMCFVCYSDAASLVYDANRRNMTTTIATGVVPRAPIDAYFDSDTYTLTFSWEVSANDCIDSYTLITDGIASTLNGSTTTVKFDGSFLDAGHNFTLWASNLHSNNTFIFGKLNGGGRRNYNLLFSGVWSAFSILTFTAVLIKIIVMVKLVICYYYKDHKFCPPYYGKWTVVTFLLQVSVSCFSFVNLFQWPIYFYNLEDTIWCAVVGGLFHLSLMSTIAVTFIGACIWEPFKNEVRSSIRKLFHSVHKVHQVAIVVCCLAVVAVFVMPLSTYSYGDSGGWCWIKTKKTVSLLNTFSGDFFLWMGKDTTRDGFIEQIIVYFLITIIGIITSVHIITAYKNIKEMTPEDKYIRNTVGCHCFLIFFVNVVIGLADRILANSSGALYELRMVHAILNSFWPLCVVIVEAGSWRQMYKKLSKE